ncbi:YciI family protein [Streptomyces tsukubensis]|uniref:YCII-related domain-containing protein n=1 Tax=Streptomyces tsukubensis TaxID=83656 RepID=A0A1V4A6I5_9ACTN|nr:YciI family protein [Streptomyces tsukubensis]OON77294.1 hypothetical protein B1H18_18765 [Streptomyces tsukubensis]QFR92368.1 hypothetical protein GBW32_03990 [Streptomyces tsukubensis]
MAVFAVFYTYTDDSARRDEFRPAHREHLAALAAEGVNLASGPYTDAATPGALLLYRAESAEEALAHTERDPFRVNGLVAEVSVRPWNPVLGTAASAFTA